MNRSWNVFSVSGIRVRVHWTLVLLLAVVGLSEWHYAGVALLGTLFGCVLLHEPACIIHETRGSGRSSTSSSASLGIAVGH